jgi:hypothetical protein
MLSPICIEKDIERHIDTTLRSHRIAITASKLVVLVLIEAQLNDLICILPGADLPLVLRKAGNKIPAREYHREAFFSAINSNMRGKFRRVSGIGEIN